jgi:hypothetical protein
MFGGVERCAFNLPIVMTCHCYPSTMRCLFQVHFPTALLNADDLEALEAVSPLHLLMLSAVLKLALVSTSTLRPRVVLATFTCFTQTSLTVSGICSSGLGPQSMVE